MFSLMFIIRLFLSGFLLLSLQCSAIASPSDDLFLAIKNNNTSQVVTLLLRGLDVNTLGKNNDTALISAVREGSDDVFNLLLTLADVEINLQNKFGETALMLAALKGNQKHIEKLLDKGANVNHPGWTALHYAASAGHDEIIKLLLENAAYIDAESPNGTTPIMMAARHGFGSTVALLINEGADITIKNQLGWTAQEFASKFEHSEVANLLRARPELNGKTP